MTRAQIIHTQKVVGATADGFWGPKSIAAAQKYLRSLMPSPNPWPASTQSALQAFYGSPGDESQLIRVDAPVPMRYEGTLVKKLLVHRKCADSLCRALAAAYKVAPEVVSDYSGIYNNRPMRGGSLPSLHSRGAAIDLAAGKNGNKTSWPIAATMPIEVMACFAREGWLAAGVFWGRDAMHMQATR